MATTPDQFVLAPSEEEYGMQQFHNADHFVEHDGSPYKEWYELPPVGQSAQAAAPAAAQAPPPGMTNISDLLG